MEAVPTSDSYTQSTFFYPLVSLTVILLAIHYYIENTRLAKFGNKLPGPRKVPFFGNALIALGLHPKDVLETLMGHDRYGLVVRAFLGPKLFIFLADPNDVEVILSSHVHIDKSPDYKYFKPWLGDGLLISTGDKWRAHRKMIAPTFHLNVLKTFVPLFYENSRDLVYRLRKHIGEEFDCHDYLSGITVDILLETAMGLRGTEEKKTGYDYAMAVLKMCDIIHRRQYDLFLKPQFLFRFSGFAKKEREYLSTIHGLTNRVIRTRKGEASKQIGSDLTVNSSTAESENTDKKNAKDVNNARQGVNTLHYVRDDLDENDENDIGEKKRMAFLDLMLELSRSGANLTDEEIKEEVDTIMFEGHDTTASASSFVLSILGAHHDIQERVVEELNEIFKGSDRQCTFQDTLEMKYLERVILETIRLFPPVPVIARQLNTDVKLATRDDILPKGCTVLIPIFKIHRLKEYYPNPDEFNPDNFLPEKMQQRHYYAFTPFSAGPRSCVGRKYAMLKLKVLLSTILRNYKILSDCTEKDFRLTVDIILKRAEGFRIKIESRNKDN